MKQVKKAVILCGGLATRFLPISKSIPKEMMPILDKPILQVIVEDLVKAGIDEIFILIGRGKECIPNHFDRNIELEERLVAMNRLDLLEKVQKIDTIANIVYKRQLEPRGTGFAVESAKSFIGDDPFVLMFGDEVMFCEEKNVVEQLLETYYEQNKSVIAIKEVDRKDVYKYGIIEPGEKIANGFNVKNIVEKPSIEDAPSNFSYIGSAVLTNDVFPAIKKLEVKEGEEINLTKSFRFLCEKNAICARIIDGFRHDMGNKYGFVKANIFASLRDDECKDKMKKLILEIAEKLKNDI